MGIIKKQTIQSTVLTYVGVAIGFLNSAILLPRWFDPEEVGLLSFLNSLTSIVATVATFGIPLITIKMFPVFRSDEMKHNGFFAITLIMSILGIGSGILFYFLFKNQLISDKNAAGSYTYFALFFCVIFASRVLFRNFDAYVKMLYKTVIGTLLNEVGVKLLIILSLLGWYFYRYDFDTVFILYSIALASAGIVMALYVASVKTGFNIKRFRTTLGDRKREMYTVGLFGIIGSLGTIIVLEVDRMMVSNMLGLYYTGIYSVAFFFGLFVSIPARGLRRIASVIISDSWKENDLDNINLIYKKSCVNLLLVSGYLFLGVWFCVPYLFDFMKDDYSQGLYVIFFIGLAQIIDMISGVNGEIIITSKYYKYNTYFIGALIALVIGLNYLFIPIWGITGAAAASCAAMFIINALRYLFLYKKFGFQPFTLKVLWNLILMGMIFTAFSFFPTLNNSIVGIVVVGSLITIAYWIPAYFFKLSTDVNEMIDKTFNRFITRK